MKIIEFIELNDREQKKEAKSFLEFWKNKGYGNGKNL